MELLTAITVLLIVVALASAGFLIIRLTAAYAERGWSAHYQLTKDTLEYQSSRIATLENKLMSHSWHDFANLQEVPDDLAKVTNIGVARTNSELTQELYRQQAVLDGEDLEGETFEGPTLG